jgi:hypothetical protein
MNIAIITDLVLNQWVGGGTLVNDYLGRRIAQAGHFVQFIRITADHNGWEHADHAQIDLYLVTNIPGMTPAQMVQLMQSGKPYVMFRHDVASICYLPEPASHPSAALVLALFQHARANIFISNIQLAYYRKLGEIPRTLVMPPPLDLSEFMDQRRAGRQGHLYIGEISEQRGIRESLQAMQSNPDTGPIAFYGQVTAPELGTAIDAAGGQRHTEIAHDQIAGLLNNYSHFYYHPRIIDAFCLKVLEAELCGMQLHVNRTNIGRYYYDASAEQLASFMKKESVEMILQLLH